MAKFWHPQSEDITRVRGEILRHNARLVVDVGGNSHFTFPGAESVGWEGDRKVDLSREPLPYGDKEVDYLYCRHTIEDLADPHHLLSEIRRVAKRGYLETPSPQAELTRGVDAAGDHLGYTHHRWICYSRMREFVCLAKYPIVERMPIPDSWSILRDDPRSWNTDHFFGDLKFRVLSNEAGFRNSAMDERGVRIEYLEQIQLALDGDRD